MPLKKRPINLQFPLLGVNKGTAYQNQPPYTTPMALNVRPRGTEENRKRGGSRPGLGKAFDQQVGGAGDYPIRLLADLDYLTGTPEALVTRVVASANGELWFEDDSKDLVKASLPTQANGPTALSSDKVIQCVQRGQILYIADWSGKKTSGTDGVYQYYNETFAGAITGTKLNGTTRIDAVPGGATEEEFVLADVGRTIWINSIGAFVISSYVSATRVEVTGDATTGASSYFVFREACQFPGTVTGVKDNGTTTITCTEEVFDSSDVTKTLRIKGVGNFVIASYTSTTVVVVTGDASAASADNYIVLTKIIFTSASVADWTTVAEAFNDLLVSDIGSVTTTINHFLYGVHPEFLFLGYATYPETGGLSSRVFYVTKAPLKFDGTSLTLWYDSNGDMPMDLSSIALYRDRIVLTGDGRNWYMSKQGDPGDWDMTAGEEDEQRPVMGTSSPAGLPGDNIKSLTTWADDYLIFGCQHSQWILRGDPAYRGVSLGPFDQRIGTVDKLSWCFGPQGQIILLSPAGLYEIPPEGSGFLRPLSDDNLPDALKDIDADAYFVSMAYDHVREGVHIFLTPASDGSHEDIDHWFFHFQDKTFWPDGFSRDHEPYCVLEHSAYDEVNNKLYLGCDDGYVREFDEAHTQDDTTDITSYVVYGPIRLGGNDYRWGDVRELIATLAKDSADVVWSIYVGDTAEEVLDAITVVEGTVSGTPSYSSTTELSTITATASVFTKFMVGRQFEFDTGGNTYVVDEFVSATQIKVCGDASGEAADDDFDVLGHFDTGQWDYSRNYSDKPRAGGGAFALKIGNATGSDYGAWVIENILAILAQRGKQRKL